MYILHIKCLYVYRYRDLHLIFTSTLSKNLSTCMKYATMMTTHTVLAQ